MEKRRIVMESKYSFINFLEKLKEECDNKAKDEIFSSDSSTSGKNNGLSLSVSKNSINP